MLFYDDGVLRILLNTFLICYSVCTASTPVEFIIIFVVDVIVFLVVFVHRNGVVIRFYVLS